MKTDINDIPRLARAASERPKKRLSDRNRALTEHGRAAAQLIRSNGTHQAQELMQQGRYGDAYRHMHRVCKEAWDIERQDVCAY